MAPESDSRPALGYDPGKLPRELKEYYISATNEEIAAMLTTLDLQSVETLFSHIDSEVKFSKPL
ncbi:MAG: hypothetical protein KJT03_21315, partial [Verrucomicrobiae bacterium]|nr:hypothetical protein [Verrucomicrobiae bacterium]